jgi:predicted nucleic acid-binding protein
MAGPLVVPDASVLLKWVLRSDDEGDRERALDLKSAWLSGACDLAVPTLWTFEVGNVLGLKEPAAAEALLAALMDLELPETTPRVYAGGILRLMHRHHVTFYDAAYHALAVHQDGIMLTADSAYVRKARSTGHLQLLSDWRPPAAARPE